MLRGREWLASPTIRSGALDKQQDQIDAET
jgi:hypothetical protein